MSGMPEIYSEYSEKFQRIHVADILGSIIPGGVDVTIYSEYSDVKQALSTHPVSPTRIKIKRVVECELIIDPMTMKNIHKWLGEKIKAYEEAFGSIPSPEEVQSKMKRKKDGSDLT